MKISVYITSYNQKDYLREAVDSVLAQTLQPYEILIVDDASTDGSQELIREYAKEYENIRSIFHETNKGVAQVRISALKNVTGDFVTYVDGDDIYLPDKLEVESKLIKENNSTVAFSNNMYCSPDNLSDIKWIWASNTIDIKENLFIKTITRDFPRKSLFRMELISTDLLKEIGYHDNNLKIYEDYDLRIRLAMKGTFNYSLQPTAKVRISKAGLSKLPNWEHLKAFEYIFEKYTPEINKLSTLEKRMVLKELDNLKSGLKDNYSRGSSSIFNRLKNKLSF